MDKLQTFLYLLMRDKMPCGEVDALVQEAERVVNQMYFTNKLLATYSKELSKKMTKQ